MGVGFVKTLVTSAKKAFHTYPNRAVIRLAVLVLGRKTVPMDILWEAVCEIFLQAQVRKGSSLEQVPDRPEAVKADDNT